MTTVSLAIEHEKTRLSLKDAFEELFVKYDREFENEDEIDILNLKVIKKGGFLAKTRIKEFGDCYQKRSALSSLCEDQQSCEEGEGEDIDEGVFCKRMKKTKDALKTVKTMQFTHQIHFSLSSSSLLEPIPLKWKGSDSFDTILYSFIDDEYIQEREAIKTILEDTCRCGTCFNCILIKEFDI